VAIILICLQTIEIRKFGDPSVREHGYLNVFYDIMYSSPAKGHESLCQACCPSSIQLHLFPLNDFFSKTTRPISTKVGRKHA